MSKIIDKVNADGTTFDVEPVMGREVEEDEALPVRNIKQIVRISTW